MGDVNQAEAAGHFHVKYLQASYVGISQYLGDFSPVGAGIIKFGTAYSDCLVFQKIAMEISIGKRDAIGNQD